MTAYYNEHDPYAAEWLRRLILNGHIAPGDVDESDIRDVRPDDLKGYTQCHFFAGIGVWSHALRRAGWPDDRPIWTGSCPCQPFSAAGARAGFADERHLWPAFNQLIEQCQPPVVAGEQVENAGDWLDLVSADMEAQGYAFGAAFLPAAGFGGAHIRSRSYWVAYTGRQSASGRRVCGPGESDSAGLGAARERSAGLRTDGGLADATRPRAPLLGRHAVDWLFCRDGKWRPTKPGLFPLVDAYTNRVGVLRAAGNALDAETATQFLEAVMASL